MKFTNPDLCALTEQVIFMDPYYQAPLNRWTSPQLDAAAADLRGDVAAKVAAFKLKQKFSQNAEALVHGDLHTGSLMVSWCIETHTRHVYQQVDIDLYAAGSTKAFTTKQQQIHSEHSSALPSTHLCTPTPILLSPQVTPSSSKMIDPEFAYMGPLAFDPAKIIGELIIPYYASDGHEAAAAAGGTPGSRSAQRVWLLEAIVEIWTTFSTT